MTSNTTYVLTNEQRAKLQTEINKARTAITQY